MTAPIPAAPPATRWVAADLDGSVLTLTLTATERLNAMNRQMAADFIGLLDWADDQDAVAAVVVTGAGRAFCAGADLSGKDQFGAAVLTAGGLDPRRDTGGQVAMRLFELSKPVIGAVNGDAVGVGMSILLPMDVRLGAPRARLGLVQSRRGIALEGCASWFLPRLVGPGLAVRWAASGRLIPADEALRTGLLDAIHEPEDLLAAARVVAGEMTVASAPVSVAVTRRMVWQALTLGHPMESHRMETDIVRRLGGTPDAREGIRSFLDRRRPRFVGSPARERAQFDRWWPARDFDPDGHPPQAAG